MATTTTLVSLEDYLRTSYHPDCDYVDDHIEERNLGEFDHGNLQAALTAWFFNQRHAWGVYAIVEQRIRVTPTRVRIADLCVIRRDAPREQVTQTPPLICIEILSPEDRLPRAAKVMEDYARMGVQHLWLLDPVQRVAYRFLEGAFHETTGRLEIASTPIHIDLPELFASLD
jgi:Uma2 family endonuclease